MLKRVIFCLVLATLAVSSTYGADPTSKKEKIDRGITMQTFIPKGTYFVGGTMSYTDFGGENFTFLILDDLNMDSYLLGGKLFAGYTFSNNVAAGIELEYSRTFIEIEGVDLSLSEDLDFSISNYGSIQQIFTASAFLRTYINIGNSKRFGMYNDVRVYFGGGQGKVTSGPLDGLYTGSYQKITKLGLVVQPGIAIFATDFMTVEASIGIMGIEYSRTEQIKDQVYQGTFESFTASFKLNLLSLGLGMAFYF